MQQQRSTFIIHLILNLSQNEIITEPGKLITFPLNVTVTGCQSISIISHNIFLYSVIFSLFMLPVNLNKCILPGGLHSLIGTYDLMSEINIIILIVLELQYFLNIGILYNFSMVKNKMHSNINDNHNIIIQYSLSMASISLLMAFTPLIIAKFATNAHIFSPLNIRFITINIIITEIIAITNIKILNAK